MVPDVLKDSNVFIKNNPVIPVCQEIFTHRHSLTYLHVKRD
jgi:hypothetical protein